MKLTAFSFNLFSENTYIISDETNECIIVDAGNYKPEEDAALKNYIAQNGLKPVMAVNTHGHVDHILGVDFVKDEYDVPFAMSSDDQYLLDIAVDHSQMYGFQLQKAPTIDVDLKEKDEITFGNSVLKIIKTPGHSKGHVCLFAEADNFLITGDTVFKESIGRTDLPGGDYSEIMHSIIENVLPLGDENKVFPGHGPSSSIGHEAMYNPYIVEVIQRQVNYK